LCGGDNPERQPVEPAPPLVDPRLLDPLLQLVRVERFRRIPHGRERREAELREGVGRDRRVAMLEAGGVPGEPPRGRIRRRRRRGHVGQERLVGRDGLPAGRVAEDQRCARDRPGDPRGHDVAHDSPAADRLPHGEGLREATGLIPRGRSCRLAHRRHVSRVAPLGERAAHDAAERTGHGRNGGPDEGHHTTQPSSAAHTGHTCMVTQVSCLVAATGRGCPCPESRRS
jgi:hypothetical protein